MDRVIRLFGPENAYVTKRALAEATERVSRFLWSALLVNAIFGVVTAVGLWMIGLPNAILWGVLAMALRFLPYIGAWISAAMPITLSLVIFNGWAQPLLAIGLFVVAELTISNFLEPLIFGRSMGISPIGVLIAAIFWTWIWGPIGLVLAMPMTVCLVVAAQYIPQLRFLDVLLGERGRT